MAARLAHVGTEQTIAAQVIRCTCGAPAAHAGTPCPQGRVEDLGIIHYWHRNPIRRLIGQALVAARAKLRATPHPATLGASQSDEC